MLKIGRKGNDVQMKFTLDEGYEDITSINMWLGVCEKYNCESTEVKKQIGLYIEKHGGTEKLNSRDKNTMRIYNRIKNDL